MSVSYRENSPLPLNSRISSASFLTSVLGLCIGVAIVASGCAGGGMDPGRLKATEVLQVAQYRQQTDEISSPNTVEFEKYLIGRLRGAMSPRVNCAQRPMDLVIIRDPRVIALSLGQDTIFVSSGLIARTTNEAEFAFVVGHELGHYCLGHLARAAEAMGKDTQSMNAVYRQLEAEADQFSVELLSRAGYSTEAAVTALVATYGQVVGLPGVPHYPSVEERVYLVKGTIAALGGMGSGTIDRRDFQGFRRGVLAKAG